MGSTRLPGKVLRDICGIPMLGHIIARLERVPALDKIVIATTTGEQDLPIVEFAAKNGVGCYRGSEDNVLDRFIKAGEMFAADLVIRVTGDCPLIDPATIGEMILAAKNTGAEYITGNPAIPVIHEGFEAVTLKALKQVEKAADRQYYREHVTIFIRETPGLFNVHYIEPEPVFTGQGYRLSVDNLADLHFIREIYRRLYRPGEIIDLRDVVALLKEHPEIRNINSHIRQKDVRARSYRVCFRVAGGPAVGFGHVRRCLALAKILHERFHCGIHFIADADSQTRAMIEKHGFPVETGQEYRGEAMLESDMLVFDVKNNIAKKDLEQVKKAVPPPAVVLMDYIGAYCAEADLVIIPAAHVPPGLMPAGKTARLLGGADYVVLGEEFAGFTGSAWSARHKELVVTMGGSDPHNITLKVLRALELSKDDYQTKVITGPGYLYKKELADFLKNSRRRHALVQSLPVMADCLKSAGAVIAAFGITVYEAASLGIPAAVVTHHREDGLWAGELAKKGFCASWGFYDDLTPAEMAEKIEGFLSDPEKLSAMGSKGRALIDGGGAGRIAAELHRLLEERHGAAGR
jgi:spore coat polysaccharide biosynthesis protein SpsF